jgi:hypothetical protein
MSANGTRRRPAISAISARPSGMMVISAPIALSSAASASIGSRRRGRASSFESNLLTEKDSLDGVVKFAQLVQWS